jgi:anti-sigma factor (TIGR02949 family)
MRCTDCREALNALLDDQLTADRAAAVRDHLAGCADCAREYDTLMAISNSLKEGLVRYTAPAQLEDRIRQSIARDEVDLERPVSRLFEASGRWTSLVAAGLAIAIASSTLTFLIAQRRATTGAVANQIVASHVRALMPGHLTDVASTNLHNVKPWFAGRVDVSPPVPALDSAGFPLAGGRVDYIDGRPVATLVYMRRQHVIDVFAWPSGAPGAASQPLGDVNGYHLIRWRTGGIELWAISDVDAHELERFVALFK